MATETGITGTTENLFTIGDGSSLTNDGYKYLYAKVRDGYLPGLRWNEIDIQWEFSNDGYVWTAISTGSSGVTDHNLLSNLQGGEVDDYYHLTPDEHIWLTDGYTTGYWSETKGGTGIVTYASGDILFADGVDSLTTLTKGTDGQVLSLSSGIPSWDTFVGLTLTATGNTAGGTGALDSLTSGNYNTVFGYNAGTSITNLSDGVAIGYNALSGGNSSRNVAIGKNALLNTTGTSNVAVGYESGEIIIGGTFNTCIGASTGNTISTGNYNVAIGQSLNSSSGVTGEHNIGIGRNALKEVTSGIGNIGIGYNAADDIYGADYNICIGYNSKVDGTSTNVVAIGYNVDVHNVNSVCIGYNGTIDYLNNTNETLIGPSNYIDDYNPSSILLGSGNTITLSSSGNTGKSIAIGSGNTISANHANAVVIGNSLTSQGSNTALLGYPTLYLGTNTDVDTTIYAYNNTGNPYLKYLSGTNKWVGSNNGSDEFDLDSGGGGVTDHNLLDNLQGGEADGYYHFTDPEHTWLLDGYTTGYWTEDKGGTGQISYASGDILFADGTDSLAKLTKGTDGQVLSLSGGVPSWDSFVGLTLTATENTAGGTGALDSLTSGTYNTAFGYNAATAINSGNCNVCFGGNAGKAITSGEQNVVIGYDAMPISNSYYNVAIGYQSLFKFNGTSTSYNTAVGHNAMYYAVSGALNNTCIGREAGNSITTGDFNIAVGSGALANSSYGTTGSYNIAIGDGSLGKNIGGTGNIAIGHNSGNAINNNSYNLSFGYNADAAEATGGYSTAIGYNSIATGTRSIVFGTSSRNYSNGATDIIILGSNNSVWDWNPNSIIIGNNSTAAGSGSSNTGKSIAIGTSNTIAANNINCFIAGDSLTSQGSNTAVFGYPTLYLGKGIAENITLYAYNSNTNKPYLRYNDATSAWQYSNNGIDGYDIGSDNPSILYNNTTPVATAQASPSPFDGNSLVVDGYLLLDADVPLAALGMASSSTHAGTTLQIIGQTDYTNTYAGGNINIQSGDGVSAGNIILKMGDSNQGNLVINGSDDTNMQSAEGAVFIGDADAVPAGNPTGGGYLYVESGSLKFRGSSGTITIIAPA